MSTSDGKSTLYRCVQPLASRCPCYPYPPHFLYRWPQVTPMAEEQLYVGVLSVLEWPKLINPIAQPPYEFDTMRTYLATSRDGIHFESDWVYANQELIPHGQCDVEAHSRPLWYRCRSAV